MEEKDYKKYNKTLTTIDKISQHLPDEPFIAVFGTSHSAGSCDRGDGTLWINDDDIWASRLAKMLGVKVVNFSVPGTTNTFLMIRVMEFLQMEKSKNCIHVIIESRYAEMALELSYDKSPFHPGTVLTQYQTSLKAMGSEVGISKFTIDNLVSNYYSSDLSKQKFHNVIKSIENVFMWRFPMVKDDDVFKKLLIKNRSNFETEDVMRIIPKPTRDVFFDKFVEDMIEYKNLYIKLFQGNIAFQVEDLTTLSTIGMLVESRGIKFNWFCWDIKQHAPIKDFPNFIASNKKFSDYFGITDGESLNNKILASIKDNYPFLFKYEIESLSKGATVEYLYETGDLPEKCNCGHQKEPFHKWVSIKIYKYLKS